MARLPTEAEWEYACRAGTTTPFSFRRGITTDQANYDGNFPYARGSKGEYRRNTVPVASLPATPWGLHEMHGNVREWCEDRYAAYPEGHQLDPVGPDKGGYRVLRGGSWIDDGGFCRSAYRNASGPGYRFGYLGFRLSRGQE